MPLIPFLVKSLPSMSYRMFNHLKKYVWYSVVATITNVDMNEFHLLACPLFVDSIQCMKKNSHKVDNIWHCGKCDGEFLECDYQYILKVDLEDITGHLHGFIYFDDAANQIMGIYVKDICLLLTEATSIVEIAQKIYNKQFLFTLSVRIETFCGIASLKVVTVMVENI